MEGGASLSDRGWKAIFYGESGEDFISITSGHRAFKARNIDFIGHELSLACHGDPAVVLTTPISGASLSSSTAIVSVPLAQGTTHTFVLEYFNGWAEYVPVAILPAFQACAFKVVPNITLYYWFT